MVRAQVGPQKPQHLLGLLCLMTAICYILYSAKLDKFYIGFTQENLHDRILKHQKGFYDHSFTQIADDWELFHHIDCETISQALQIEKHIKRMKSRSYLMNLKQYQEISEKLKEKYKNT